MAEEIKDKLLQCIVDAESLEEINSAVANYRDFLHAQSIEHSINFNS